MLEVGICFKLIQSLLEKTGVAFEVGDDGTVAHDDLPLDGKGRHAANAKSSVGRSVVVIRGISHR